VDARQPRRGRRAAGDQNELRAKSRDLVRRNAWARPASRPSWPTPSAPASSRSRWWQTNAARSHVQALWRDWTRKPTPRAQTDFYGLQALACRAMLEGGECLVRLRYRRPEDGLPVAAAIAVAGTRASADHASTPIGGERQRDARRHRVRQLGRRVAYHLYRSHPEDGALAPMSGQGGMDTVRVDAPKSSICSAPLRPGQIRGEPWLARALVKLNELDQYDDAELVRKKTAAMFAGFVTRQNPEDNLMGEGCCRCRRRRARRAGAGHLADPGARRGHQVLRPSRRRWLSYGEFLRMQFRAVAAAIGITYEQLTGDLTGR
jgi:lambda family phage portal protein